VSDLGNLIVAHGRWQPGEALPDWADEDYVAAQLNALRDELIELRAKAGAHDRLQALLAQAAAGRREYAVNAPDDSALILEDQARQLEAVARLARGDMTVMTAWLPSWRWTDEMAPEVGLRATESAERASAEGRDGDGAETRSASRRTPRIRACVETWPECESGMYDPRCCRFPKSCSCTSYDSEQVTDEYLEERS
jgi:hypothetical protein